MPWRHLQWFGVFLFQWLITSVRNVVVGEYLGFIFTSTETKRKEKKRKEKKRKEKKRKEKKRKEKKRKEKNETETESKRKEKMQRHL
jgi:hypothetical protein